MALAILTACNENSNTEQAEVLPSFSVAKPEQRDITYRMEYPGYLKAEYEVEIVTRTEGTINQVYFKPGQDVKEGDILFLIDPKTYQDKVNDAEAALQTAKANYALATTTLSRVEDAAKSNAVSEIDVIEARTKVDLCKAQIKSAEANLSIARTNLGYCTIKAPYSGVISINLQDAGNYVQPQTKLATLYKIDKIYARFSIEESKLIYARKYAEQAGLSINKIEVLQKDIAGESSSFEGIIDYKAPSAEISTGTIDMRAVIDNKDRKLSNGEYVKVRVPYYDKKDAVMISESSIGNDQQGRFIYVVENDTVRYRPVKVGQLEDDNMREIESGLSADETYITKAITRVRDGMAIAPKMESKTVATESDSIK